MRKTVLISTVLLSFNLFASSAGSELKHAFDKLGFSSNVSDSSTYSTQAAGYSAFGSVYARSEARNLQIMHIDAPGIRSGCGGIDIFAGGFSFITSDEIVRFMKSILSNGAGYALNLALETELPEMAHSMQYMQSIATKINSQNMSSCELSESLVQGLYPKRRLAHQKLCEDIGMNNSIFTDWASAKQECSTGSSFDSTMEAGKKDPKYKDRSAINKNVVWDAIRSNGFLKSDTGLAEVYMSVSGTLVFDKNGGVTTYPSLATNRDFVKAMLYGGKLPTYQCKNKNGEDNCLEINFSEGSTYQTISTENALVPQVEKLINDIYQKLLSDTPLTDEEKGLIGMSQSEVFRLISSNAQQGVGVQGAHILAETIAAEILSQFLSNTVNIIRNSLAGKEIEEESQKHLYKNLANVQVFVNEIESNSRSQFNQALQTNRLINANVKVAMSQLGPLLATQ